MDRFRGKASPHRDSEGHVASGLRARAQAVRKGGGTTVPEVEEPGGTQHKGGGHCHVTDTHKSLQAVCCGQPGPRGCGQETQCWKWARKGGEVLTSPGRGYPEQGNCTGRGREQK